MNSAWSRRAAIATWDVLSWSVATALVLGLRYDFSISEVQWDSVVRYWLFVGVLMLVLGYATRFYRGRFLVGSFDEAFGLAVHVGVIGVAGIVAGATLIPSLPRSLPVLTPPVALLLCAAGRWFYRAVRDHSGERGTSAEVPNVLVYGAGDAGLQVLQLLRNDRDSKFRVVGFIDDNPDKRHLKILGVPVLGNGLQLRELAITSDVEAIILAVPNAPGEVVGQIQERAQLAGLDFFVLPRLSEIVGGRVGEADIRPVEIGDVLGRHQVSTNLGSIAGYITGKRVLITGAGGSIGTELARQVHTFGPKTLVMLDRDESHLHAVQLAIFGHGLLDAPDTVLVDIRDEPGLRKIFERHRPEVVFHAAALKHLPMLERFPDEGWKTNVLGTRNLLELASEFDVERFVNISTDKAADATSVLGATKRVGEQLTSWYSLKTGRPFISVRFGNVLGSRGSMLDTFNAQIAAGGPLTVTHPDVSRYFMTIPEACELVVQAGAIGLAGDALVLEMGTPVKILDVAKRMIRLSGAHGVEIVFTGLRPGEKLHEVLIANDERASSTGHQMIRTVSVPAIGPDGLSDPKDGADATMVDFAAHLRSRRLTNG